MLLGVPKSVIGHTLSLRKSKCIDQQTNLNTSNFFLFSMLNDLYSISTPKKKKKKGLLL